MVEKIADLVANLKPIALIGAGGIGKTSIALSILHHDRIKEQFGDDRRFIRCDQFQATPTHFLSRFSEVVGAGIENPENLALLRPFLFSKRMVIVLDNAESILDPQGTNAQELYSVVEELSRFDNICLFITSRIFTIPPNCETLEVPTLAMEDAHNAFYSIYKNGERSSLVDDVLEQLDFHPLSVTLLATVAHQNKWNTSQLVKRWERQRTDVLQTDHKTSLAATIELSLSSPMFKELGPDARAMLEAVAFFPQGINENNLDWLFSAISNRENIFDKFRTLSLTHQTNDFATMLAPLRECLHPKDPKSSALLCAIKDHYFTRLAVDVDPDKPWFEETRWIVSEDVNVEYLLEVFTSIDAGSNDIWDACVAFMDHLYQHKSRLTVLGPKIEGLPDGHPSKPQCLFGLSRLLGSVGDREGSKRLLSHTLQLARGREDNPQAARALVGLAEANRFLFLHEEGIPQAKEALEIYERLEDTEGQADSLGCLAFLYLQDNMHTTAVEVSSRAVDLSSGERKQSHLCEYHHILGHRYSPRQAQISHHIKALDIALSLNSLDRQTQIFLCLIGLFIEEDRLDDAQAYIEQHKLKVVNSPFNMAATMMIQAFVWDHGGRVDEAKSEALRCIDLYKKLGVSGRLLKKSEAILREFEEKKDSSVTSDTFAEDSGSSEFLTAGLQPTALTLSQILNDGGPPGTPFRMLYI